MVPERAELRLVRESLEAVVSPAIVSAVVFEALAAVGGRLSADPGAVAELVDGPLRHALRARLGDDADPVIDDALRIVKSVAGAARPTGRDADVTRPVVLDARPVIVLVVASGTGFAMQLQAALGSARVTTVPVATLDELTVEARGSEPHIVLIDAADFAPIEPDQLAGALEALPGTTVRAIWGADLPYGGAALRALVARRAPATPLDRREGIDPLLDLVRSRRVG